jgi:hypothetical protein
MWESIVIWPRRQQGKSEHRGQESRDLVAEEGHRSADAEDAAGAGRKTVAKFSAFPRACDFGRKFGTKLLRMNTLVSFSPERRFERPTPASTFGLCSAQKPLRRPLPAINTRRIADTKRQSK